MKTTFKLKAGKLAAYQTGPLAGYISGFAELLAGYGYSTEHALSKIRHVRDFSRWLRGKHLGVTVLNEDLIAAYRAGPRHRQHGWGERATLTLLLGHLRDLEVVPRSQPPLASSLDRLVEEYRRHQLEDRCLGVPTVTGYVAVVHRLMNHVFDGRRLDFRRLTAANINGFVLKETTRLGRKACQLGTCAIKSFLNFLLMTGRLDRDLASGVPRVAVWPASSLPHYLQPAEVRKLLATCDRKTDRGKRNFAIMLLLARLGLRAGEVSKLELHDIDWNAAEIRLRGKHDRIDRLPLPHDVGRAVAEYLKCRRAESLSNRLFLHVNAPYLGLVASPPNTVSSIVRRALKRADLNPPHRGAHILRHSLATRMLRNGVSLFHIGQVLRHATLQATEVYAKVDLTSLRKIAQPWPGGAS